MPLLPGYWPRVRAPLAVLVPPRLGKNRAGADVADDLIGGVRFPARIMVLPSTVSPWPFRVGSGPRRWRAGRGVLQQAVAGGEAGIAAGIEVGGAVVQEPPAESRRW